MLYSLFSPSINILNIVILNILHLDDAFELLVLIGSLRRRAFRNDLTVIVSAYFFRNGKRLKRFVEVTTDCEIMDNESVSRKSLSTRKILPNVPEQSVIKPNADKPLSVNHQLTDSVNIL